MYECRGACFIPILNTSPFYAFSRSRGGEVTPVMVETSYHIKRSESISCKTDQAEQPLVVDQTRVLSADGYIGELRAETGTTFRQFICKLDLFSLNPASVSLIRVRCLESSLVDISASNEFAVIDHSLLGIGSVRPHWDTSPAAASSQSGYQRSDPDPPRFVVV